MLATNPMDKEMLDRAMAIIERHLDNPEFNVNIFAREMGMARTNLFTQVESRYRTDSERLHPKYTSQKGAVMLRNNPELNITKSPTESASLLRAISANASKRFITSVHWPIVKGKRKKKGKKKQRNIRYYQECTILYFSCTLLVILVFSIVYLCISNITPKKINIMRNVSRLFPLLPGIAMLTGCNHASQKNNGQNVQNPNIIYIFADDLGIGDLSCYGASKISTPNIDRLAGQGVQFTNAYATSATSTPSRFGLLTGMYPWRQENTGIAPGNSELIIDTACVTMADMLKDAGYATGAVGKWHLGLGPKGGTDFNSQISPNAQSIGFDYEFIIPATVDRVPCVFVENGRVVNLDPNDPITVSYDHKVGDWPTEKKIRNL